MEMINLNYKKVFWISLFGYWIILLSLVSISHALDQTEICERLGYNLTFTIDMNKCDDFWDLLTNKSITIIYNVTNINISNTEITIYNVTNINISNTEITIQNITNINITNINQTINNTYITENHSVIVEGDHYNITNINITNTTIHEDIVVNFMQNETNGFSKAETEKLVRDEVYDIIDRQENTDDDDEEVEEKKGFLDYIFSVYGIIMLIILGVGGYLFKTQALQKLQGVSVHDPDAEKRMDFEIAEEQSAGIKTTTKKRPKKPKKNV